jgi:hypothetical protein
MGIDEICKSVMRVRSKIQGSSFREERLVGERRRRTSEAPSFVCFGLGRNPDRCSEPTRMWLPREKIASILDIDNINIQMEKERERERGVMIMSFLQAERRLI